MHKFFAAMTIVFLLQIGMFPFQSSGSTKTRSEYEKTGNVIWETQTDEKLVAITFDDGPHPIFTPQILDILKEHNGKATFFVAGNKVARFPEVLQRTYREGHEIANHTYNHIYSPKITRATLTSELERTDEIIKQNIGIIPNLFRPVGGLYNDLIIDTAAGNRKLVVLWSWQTDAKDWRKPPASKIAATIKKTLKPGNIILLHDWIGNEDITVSNTVSALEDVMEYLSRKGYKCVTVSELLYRSNQPLPDHIDPFS